jgi:hypothetical protein
MGISESVIAASKRAREIRVSLWFQASHTWRGPAEPNRLTGRGTPLTVGFQPNVFCVSEDEYVVVILTFSLL